MFVTTGELIGLTSLHTYLPLLPFFLCAILLKVHVFDLKVNWPVFEDASDKISGFVVQFSTTETEAKSKAMRH